MAQGTVLIADDDTAIRTVLTQALARSGYSPRATGNAATLWRWVSEGQGDLVVTDVVMPDENAFDLIPRIKRLRPELPIIVMSAQNTLMTAITAAEKGAYEYLPKPFDLNELLAVVGRALAEPSRRTMRSVHEVEGEDLPLVGRSAPMQEIYRVVARLTQTDLTVMITGESGTGKELVARALHDYGKRRTGPFVAVNMAAIPRELIESELFGHEKGAFTGAQARAPGRFEQAEGGTLFLDEIGDMPMEAQTRLLRVLQEGEYTTVGGRTPIRTDVRIIAATHRDLRTQIQQGLFREDLFYRLNVVPMRLPPLRERLEDIGDLVRHFLRLSSRDGLGAKTIDQGALERLKSYHWPGNVRELENLVRRLVALHPQDAITAELVDTELAEVSKRPHEERASEARSLSEMVEQHLGEYFAAFGKELPPPGLYDRIIAEVERPLLLAALAATRGNQI
ncbi:MAG: nitrogen regulation protein NR(I), partial [Hyphomicrobiaceae bacterium]|nr:nitrogen regulation protein NR(I) [Hyphomicrobiaceae bacterium]